MVRQMRRHPENAVAGQRLLRAPAWRSLLAFLVLGLLVAALAAPPTMAQGGGACSASVNGVPVSGNTIRVGRNGQVELVVTAPAGQASNTVYLEVFGRRWEIASARSNGGQWLGRVPVVDFARWGVGLYKVVWQSQSLQGEVLCSASAKIRVEGFPFGSVIGLAGAVSFLVGASGLILSTSLKTILHEGGKWVLKIAAKAGAKRDKNKAAAGATPAAADQRRWRLSANFSLAHTLWSTLFGLLLSGGSLATLQEAGVSLPTVQLGLQITIPLTAFSLLLSWIKLSRA